MPDMPLRRADGSIYGTAGRPSGTYLIMQIQSMESIMKAVDEAGEKWAAQIVPEISEYMPYKDEDTGEQWRPIQPPTICREEIVKQIIQKTERK